MALRLRLHDSDLYKCPINEMAYHRPEMAAKIVAKTNDILAWWGFLYYLSHYVNTNNLMHHEKGKLIALLNELCADKVKGGNDSKVKRKILLSHWGDGGGVVGGVRIPGREIMSDERSVWAIVSAELYKECVDVGSGTASEICRAFMTDAPRLVDLICDGDASSIRDYVDRAFPET